MTPQEKERMDRLEETLEAISKKHLFCPQCLHHDTDEGDWKAIQDSRTQEWDLICPKCGCEQLLDCADEIADAALKEHHD